MYMEGGGATQDFDRELKTDEIASPTKHSAKRLLPMELRKRRRAAKLQVNTAKQARVLISNTTSPSTPTRSEEAKELSTTDGDSYNTIPTVASPTKAVNESSFSISKSPGVKEPAATVSTRLHSLYNSSLLSQKAQRRLVGPRARVPHTFTTAELPLDVVPKTKVSILTAFPVPFHRTTSTVKEKALLSFTSGKKHQRQSLASQSTAVRWQQALHYFVHPADPMPTYLNRTSTLSSSEALLRGHKREHQREENQFFTTRWHKWQEAFRDIYMTFRRQSTSAIESDASDVSFYLRSSEYVVHFMYEVAGHNATKAEWSIIDLYRQQNAEIEHSHISAEKVQIRRLRAVMSQSSARIRKILHHLNVAYTMPYSKANQTEREFGEFHVLDEEFEASRQQTYDRSGNNTSDPVTRATAVSENVHGADSLLLFYGHDAVHGLYEFLINRTPMSNQDVPELYALYPFANASIQSLRVTSFGRVGAVATELGSKDRTSESATCFRLELVGFCFPSSVSKLLGVLKDEWIATHSSYTDGVVNAMTATQEGQFVLRTFMEAMAGAERLNAIKLDEAFARGFNENSSDDQKCPKRQLELEISKRCVETMVVTRKESRYDVETTVRANLS